MGVVVRGFLPFQVKQEAAQLRLCCGLIVQRRLDRVAMRRGFVETLRATAHVDTV